METIATKFVSWDVCPLNELNHSKAYIMREKLNNGQRLSREEKNFLTRSVMLNSYSRSGIPVMGWMFDFSDVLKTFLVKQYGRWEEHKGFDKTAIRASLFGRIDHIIEVKL
jgi:hypothetical protein